MDAEKLSRPCKAGVRFVLVFTVRIPIRITVILPHYRIERNIFLQLFSPYAKHP